MDPNEGVGMRSEYWAVREGEPDREGMEGMGRQEKRAMWQIEQRAKVGN